MLPTDNIIYSRKGKKVKIIDFGLSREVSVDTGVIEPANDPMTSGTVAGTYW